WGLIFLVDFTLTAILLVPQLLAWAYAHPEKVQRRVMGMWLLFLPAPFLIARIGENAGAPISGRVVLSAMLILGGIFLLPALLGWGVRIRHGTWNRAGFAAALMYIACTAYAHHVALLRIQRFADLFPLQVESIGALPLPPSLWRWDGLVRTDRGVNELRDRKSTRLNSSHVSISYAVFCLKKKKNKNTPRFSRNESMLTTY